MSITDQALELNELKSEIERLQSIYDEKQAKLNKDTFNNIKFKVNGFIYIKIVRCQINSQLCWYKIGSCLDMGNLGDTQYIYVHEIENAEIMAKILENLLNESTFNDIESYSQENLIEVVGKICDNFSKYIVPTMNHYYKQ